MVYRCIHIWAYIYMYIYIYTYILCVYGSYIYQTRMFIFSPGQGILSTRSLYGLCLTCLKIR